MDTKTKLLKNSGLNKPYIEQAIHFLPLNPSQQLNLQNSTNANNRFWKLEVLQAPLLFRGFDELGFLLRIRSYNDKQCSLQRKFYNKKTFPAALRQLYGVLSYHGVFSQSLHLFFYQTGYKKGQSQPLYMVHDHVTYYLGTSLGVVNTRALFAENLATTMFNLVFKVSSNK